MQTVGMPPYKAYSSNVRDEEWAFVVPYLTLQRLDHPQRQNDLRAVFDGLRYALRSGCTWRDLPGDFPPWYVVYQQGQRWLDHGVFETVVHDLRALLRMAEGRAPTPTAVIFDSQTVQSTPSSEEASYDGAKRKKGRKIHEAVDTLGILLAVHITTASAQDRDQVAALAQQVQEVTGSTVQIAYVDQGYTGERPATAAAAHGIDLVVVKHPEGTKGFLLLPRRWVVERSFGWRSRFRRLARDYERLPATVRGLTFLAYAIIFLSRAATTMPS